MAFKNRFAGLGGASLLALVIGMASAAAQAGTLVALTDDNQLVKIDTGTMAATPPMAISGAGRVVGIDVRPADGKLWGLTESGQLVMIDPMTGTATLGGMLSEKVVLGARPVAPSTRWPIGCVGSPPTASACASTSTPARRPSTSR